MLVVGITGAGKTELGRQLASRLASEFVEVDALSIGPGWSEPATFLSDVASFTSAPRWVADSYGAVPAARELMWSRATLIVWLDLRVPITTWRTLKRSLRRSWHREPLYGGNVETWRSWLSGDHPLWWSVRAHANRRRIIKTLISHHRVAHVRLGSPRSTRDFLCYVSRLHHACRKSPSSSPGSRRVG